MGGMLHESGSGVHERDPFESTELVRRLRRMSWAIAAPAVKQRVFERISAHASADRRLK
jgi:hypothetical protein